MKKLFRILGKRGRITIPYEIRQRVGFSYNDVLSFTEADDGRTVIVKRERSVITAGAQPAVVKDDRLRSLTLAVCRRSAESSSFTSRYCGLRNRQLIPICKNKIRIEGGGDKYDCGLKRLNIQSKTEVNALWQPRNRRKSTKPVYQCKDRPLDHRGRRSSCHRQREYRRCLCCTRLQGL